MGRPFVGRAQGFSVLAEGEILFTTEAQRTTEKDAGMGSASRVRRFVRFPASFSVVLCASVVKKISFSARTERPWGRARAIASTFFSCGFRDGRVVNPKHEIRNPKQIPKTKPQKIPNPDGDAMRQGAQGRLEFGIFFFGICFGFRISCFGFVTIPSRKDASKTRKFRCDGPAFLGRQRNANAAWAAAYPAGWPRSCAWPIIWQRR